MESLPHYAVRVMARFRISRITSLAAGIAITVLLIACTPPDSAPGALPVGMRTAPVPSVDANAYVYFKPPGHATFSSEALGVDGLTLQSADFLLADDSDAVAARFITDPRDDESSADGADGDGQGRWTDADTTSLRVGPVSPWGDRVRSAWAREPSASFATRYPDIWDDLQSMPEAPPSPPIAAGFVRNFGPLLEHLIRKADITVPNLTDGLSLVRVDNIAFVAYADDFSQLPESLGPESLRDLDVSILAVADSTYPALVVGRVFDGFVSALGLSPVSIADVTAYEREVSDGIHAVVLRDGTTLFFAIAPTARDAIALIQATVTSRSGV